MATIKVIDYIANVIEDTYVNLKTAVSIVTKNLQEFADSVALDPDADNSNVAFDISRQLYSPFYFNVYTREVTTDYNNWDKGSGLQPCLCYGIIEINNETVSIHDMQLLGRVPNGDKWDWLTPTEIDDVKNLISNALNGLNPVFTPDNPVYYRYSSYLNGYIVKTTDNSNITFADELPEKTIDKSSVPFDINLANIVYDEDTDYWTDFQTSYGGFKCTVKQPLVVVTTQESFATDYVANNGATNNYVDTFLTLGGNLKVYYGDNYIIYVVPSGVKVTYDIMFNVTKQVTQVINGDNPGIPQIVVPTYDENKYGPGPEPGDIDEDIEVDMTLNDAAYGAGLSHYYVTTVGSTVLEDISAAMSTWDIVNTGKDLYKNLISCRITKVGPIPSESSTFVIYGEELQYNGSPITITKITGNPSMDLGEYEILPKFYDFRDYAPFTKLEMFIPYCGWVSLPSHCMSSEEDPKIITGTLLCDIIAGTCKAVIKCNDTVVAEASGFTAIDVPFTGENVGMKMAGIASSITSYGNQAAKTVGSVASGGMSGGAGAGAALAGGIVGMLGSYAQMYSAFNANYTEICGKTGDGCNVAGLGSVYIKIQRPKAGETEAPYYVPANYAHTTGFMSMKQKAISECNGLIVCANVDTSGISGATARERAEIKRLLETGIYVNLTPPEPPEP